MGSLVWLLAHLASGGLTGCATVRSQPAPSVITRGARTQAHREPELVQVHHLVKRGETLYRIARAYGMTVDQLMTANQLEDPRELREGERLLIPGATQQRRVPPFDAPEPVARTPVAIPGVRTDAAPVAATKPEPRPAARPAARSAPPPVKVGRKGGTLDWPLRGVLYARFGKKGRELHDGIDLSAPAGSPVRSAAEGTVLFAGEQRGYGLIAIIEHPGGLMTLYAHNRDLRVRTGQQVRRGQVVATVGDSGKTSGPHLHFEVRREGVPVDPLDYLGPVPPAS